MLQKQQLVVCLQACPEHLARCHLRLPLLLAAAD
jgi:hypothetical protein